MKQNDPLRIYLSGAISENPDAVHQFMSAAKALMNDGFEVVNPFTLSGSISLSWTDYMRTDIKELMGCDAICSLDGWVASRGARLERMIAGELALLIFEGIEDARLWLEAKKKAA